MQSRSQETGVTGKFGLGIGNEVGQRLIEFCQENALVMAKRKAMTNLDSVIKSRDIILPAKVHMVKATVLPVVMYGCELDHKKA